MTMLTKNRDKITLEVHQQAVRGQTPAVYVVKRGTSPIGWLERYQNTREETHPWRAFTYKRAHLGTFYDTGSVPDDGDTQFGGRNAALKAITG